MSQQPTLKLRTSRLVMVLILVGTGIPAAFGPPLIQWGRWNIVDILANILLYLPLGLALADKTSARRAGLVAGGLSTTIEVVQLFSVNRISHPIDVACNVLGTLLGYAQGRRSPVPQVIGAGRTFGVAAVMAAGLWILSSRTFRMYVGGFGWFASERRHPRLWSMLPADVIHTGVEIHSLGVLANTAIAAILLAVGVNAIVQARHPGLWILLAGAAGYSAGNVMTPNLNVYPMGPVAVGTSAALAVAACFVNESQNRNTAG